MQPALHYWITLSEGDTVYVPNTELTVQHFQRAWNLGFLSVLWAVNGFDTRLTSQMLINKFGLPPPMWKIHQRLRHGLLSHWWAVKDHMKGKFDIELDELIGKQKEIISISFEKGTAQRADALAALALCEKANMNLLRVAADIDTAVASKRDLLQSGKDILDAIKEGALQNTPDSTVITPGG